MLCHNCSNLDLSAVFDGKSQLLADRYIPCKTNSEAVWTWNPTLSCDLCRFLTDCSQFSHAKYSDEDGPIITEPKWLRTSKGGASFDFKASEPILEVVFERPPVQTTPTPPESITDESWVPQLLFGRVRTDLDQAGNPLNAPCLIPPYLDIAGTLRSLIQNCHETHENDLCAVNAQFFFAHPLRVLDCTSRQVVPAPDNCQYAAISYTWGATAGPAIDSGHHSSYPQTVEDAMTFTLRVGLQYLWVDKYCIDQNDAAGKHQQIKQMDLVYQNARVTIVAAAGDSPDYGLPGVSRPRRKQQTSAVVSGLHLVSFNQSPWDPIWESKWNTRGWTYQEVYLSRRRLFFTDEQVIYDCANSWNCESISVAQQKRNVQTYIGFLYPYLPKWALYDLIRDYSRRQLTFSTDIIHAFQGLLNAFESRQASFQHFWGTPCFLGEGLLDSFITGLTWEFNSSNSRLRRPGFPSWSWTGWECGAHYRYWFNPDKADERVYDVVVHIEMADGSRISLTEFGNLSIQNRALHSVFIILEAWTVTVSLENLPEEDDDSAAWYGLERVNATIGAATHPVDFRHDMPSKCEAHEADVRTPYECHGVMLYDSVPTDEHVCSALLLVERKGDHWERVGILSLMEFVRQMVTPDLDPQEQKEWQRKRLKAERQEIRLG